MADGSKWLILIVGAYLLGSLPFALIIGWTRGVDIRSIGSGNIGASNVGRALGRPLGMLCFVLDVLKGYLPVMLAGLWFGLAGSWAAEAGQPAALLPTISETLLWMSVGIAAFLGHVLSIFLRFRGGKGVATGFGMMLGLFPYLTWPALAALIVWVIVLALGRMISLASMIAAGSLPIWCLINLAFNPAIGMSGGEGPLYAQRLGELWPFPAITLALAILIVLRHRGNIGRIIAGTEPRIAEANAPPPQPGAGSGK